MMNSKKMRGADNFLFILLILVIGFFNSCRKTDIHSSIYLNNSERFFKNEKKLDEIKKEVYEKLKIQNEKDHFVDNLPRDIGTPIWNKIKIEKVKNFNAKSAGSVDNEIVYIPLSNDNKYLSGILVAEKQTDSVFSFEPLRDEYLYNLCHKTNMDIEKAEKMLGIFLYMDSYTFEKTEYENIPVQLFASALGYDTADGKKKMKIKAINSEGRLAPIEDWGEICWLVATPNSCTCAGGVCHDWQDGCADCSDTYCFRWMLGGGGGGGGGLGGSDGGSGGGGGGGYGDGYDPPDCGGRWYREQPCNGNGSGNNNEIDENGFYYTKIDTLKANILLNPFALIPCDSLNLMPLLQYGSMFQQVAQYKVPQSILTRLDSIRQAQGAWGIDDYNIQALTNAYGPVVNCDFFPIKITQMPFKSTGVQWTSKELLEYFRLNINDFITPPVYVSFNPSGSPYFTDYAHWNLPYQDALGSVVQIHIPGPLGTSNDGSVLLSDYSNINSTYQHNYFKFSTLETPFDYEHPVAGNREFGIYNSSANPNQFTFYVMGVDRIWDLFTQGQNLFVDGFRKSDTLWNNVQNNLQSFINSNGGQASFYTPKAPKARPDYNAVKEYLEGKISKDSLSIKLGCI